MARRNEQLIVSTLTDLGGFRSAQELHQHLRAAGRAVGLATVYRVLADLERDGGVETSTRQGETLYCACRTGHHHHLVCVMCGTSRYLEVDEIERWVAAVAAESGFRAVSHTIEVRGVCASCPAPSR